MPLLSWLGRVPAVVRLANFSLSYIVSTGIAAVIFILAIKWAGKRWPSTPVVGGVARSI